jgi:hypothetical protein
MGGVEEGRGEASLMATCIGSAPTLLRIWAWGGCSARMRRTMLGARRLRFMHARWSAVLPGGRQSGQSSRSHGDVMVGVLDRPSRESRRGAARGCIPLGRESWPAHLQRAEGNAHWPTVTSCGWLGSPWPPCPTENLRNGEDEQRKVQNTPSPQGNTPRKACHM